MRHLKKYKLFESIDIDSDIEDIKEILNDITDRQEDVHTYVSVNNPTLVRRHILIKIHPSDWTNIRSYFIINKNIKSTIQRIDYLYRNDYTIQYRYLNLSLEWNDFYVYDDDRGLRSGGHNLHGSLKYPPSNISYIMIKMIPKLSNESFKLFESIDSERIDIKEMMNDITDNYDVFSDFDRGYLTKSKEDYIIFSLNGEFSNGAFLKFTIDEYIESIFKRLNYTYSSEYNIKYYIHFFKNKKYQTKEFYVDEDGMFFKEENIFGYDRIEMIGVEPSSIGVEMSKKY